MMNNDNYFIASRQYLIRRIKMFIENWVDESKKDMRKLYCPSSFCNMWMWIIISDIFA